MNDNKESFYTEIEITVRTRRVVGPFGAHKIVGQSARVGMRGVDQRLSLNKRRELADRLREQVIAAMEAADERS